MREMKESGISWVGEIPSNWVTNKIKYALIQRTENNNPIRSKNILSLTAKQGVIPLSEKEGGGNKPKEDYSAYRLAYPGDIVMNSMNVLSGSVGLSNYFGCVSPVYYMLRPANEMDDVRFYNYIFQTKIFQKSLFGLGNGILIKESDNGNLNTIRMRIPMDKLGGLYLPIPNPKEQKKIADYLDFRCAEIDSLSTDIISEVNTLEAYKRSVIEKAVTTGKQIRFKYIATICSNLVNPLNYQAYHQIAPDSIEKNTGRVILERTVEEAAVDSWNHLFYKGQILYSKIRPVLNKVTIAPYDGLCSADIYPIKAKENTKFVMYAMLSQSFVKQVDVITRDRIKMPKINQEELGNIRVFIPEADEQKRVVRHLDSKCEEIDEIISNKQEQLKILADYKKSLIYEYVTGKKEVPANG